MLAGFTISKIHFIFPKIEHKTKKTSQKRNPVKISKKEISLTMVIRYNQIQYNQLAIRRKITTQSLRKKVTQCL